jgi:hypothetical protein
MPTRFPAPLQTPWTYTGSLGAADARHLRSPEQPHEV